MKDIVGKKLVKEKEGGILAGLFGFTHIAPLKEAMQRGQSPQQVTFVDTVVVSAGEPELAIDGLIRNHKEVADLMYARDMLGKMALSIISQHLRARKRLSVLALNYESIGAEIVRIGKVMELGQIGELCERRVNLVEFFRNHPLANALQNI